MYNMIIFGFGMFKPNLFWQCCSCFFVYANLYVAHLFSFIESFKMMYHKTLLLHINFFDKMVT